MAPDDKTSPAVKYAKLREGDSEAGQGSYGSASDGEKEYRDDELKINGGKYDSKMCVGQVTIRLPLDLNPLNLMALLYGFLPWIIPAAFGVHWLVTRHFISLYAVCITGFITTLNEFILKPILKQPRPPQSANRDKEGRIKPGMPSGHVYNATGLMVWATLEVALRGPGYDTPDETRLTEEWLMLIFFLMGPVPWARWYNLDHTAAQCAVSLVLGTITGAAAFYLRATHFENRWKYWDP